jgi:hypothetical protein
VEKGASFIFRTGPASDEKLLLASKSPFTLRLQGSPLDREGFHDVAARPNFPVGFKG